LVYKCTKGNLSPQSIRAIIVMQSSGRFFSATRHIKMVYLSTDKSPIQVITYDSDPNGNRTHNLFIVSPAS